MYKNNKINQFLRINLLLVVFVLINKASLSQDTVDKNYVFSICDQVANPDNQVENIELDTLASLPIGIRKEIAGTTYIIAIDSAEFTPEGAY